MDEVACDEATFLQVDVVHSQSTVRERLKRLAGQSGAQGDPSGSQSSPSA